MESIRTNITHTKPIFKLLIDSNFRRVNRLFVLLFENDEHRRSYKQYFLLSVEIEDIIIDGKNVFVQTVKNDLRTGKYSSR